MRKHPTTLKLRRTCITSFLLLALTLNTCQALAMQKEVVINIEMPLIRQEAQQEKPEAFETGLRATFADLPYDVIRYIILPKICDDRNPASIKEDLKSLRLINKNIRDLVDNFIIKDDFEAAKKNIGKKRKLFNWLHFFCLMSEEKAKKLIKFEIINFEQEFTKKIEARLDKSECNNFPVLFRGVNGNNLKILSKENAREFLAKNNVGQALENLFLDKDKVLNKDKEYMDIESIRKIKLKVLLFALGIICLILLIILGCMVLGGPVGFTYLMLYLCTVPGSSVYDECLVNANKTGTI